MLHHGADGHCAGGLQAQLALHAGAGKHRIDLGPVGIVPRQADEGFAFKVPLAQQRLLRQWVAGWQHGHFVHGRQGLAARARRCIGQLGQAQIEALGRHPLLQQRCLLGAHAHGHRAVTGLQTRQRARQQGMTECRQAQHADARTLRAPQLHGAVDHALQALPAAPHLVPEQQGTCIGTQPALHTLEQRIAQQLLHARQLAAHRGLGGIEQLRRAGDAAGRHDGTEHLDMAMGDALRSF